VRLFRAVLGLDSEFYNRYIIRNSSFFARLKTSNPGFIVCFSTHATDLFAPLVHTLLATGSTYNLLNSTLLELFDFVRSKNVRSLLQHIHDAFGPRLKVFLCVVLYR
jgi:protein phosphatase-4 regulatory subunit 3